MLKSQLFLHSWFGFLADQYPVLYLAAKFTRLEENVILFSSIFVSHLGKTITCYAGGIFFILTVLKCLYGQNVFLGFHYLCNI